MNKTNRKLAGLGLALVLIVVALFASGCARVNPEVARAEYTQAVKIETDAKGSMDAATRQRAIDLYQKASAGNIPEQAQALADLGRLTVEAKKYDAAVQAYTLLSQQHVDAQVVTTPPWQVPADKRVVKDWIGPYTDQLQNGPLWKAEEALDGVNRQKFAYKVMDALVAATGRNPYFSYFFALLVFTAVVKLAMTPLTVSQFHTTRKMTAVQPKMKALQEQYKDKPEEMNRAMMKLYKDEGVNPVGCGATMLIQFPILIALYSVIRLYNFQFRNGYFLWVNPATHALSPGIIGKNLAQPDIILLVLYAISMYLSQKLTVMPAQDEQQRQQQMMMAYMMPIMFLWILKTFPSAFILYWLMFNAFTTWQQWHLLKKFPPPPPGELAVATAPVAPAPRTPSDGPSRGPSRTPAKRKKK